ncbi:uncharacterized protein LOC124897696 [Capsicum annuum]|uniref:uncharacterized protein LOC124897696 n=1 Tax=Capsicum annuum TaxID=4072 RepID=UPI001FB12C01|nr:uncharacterized protein LOC124897696 [Capsicum annuum]
MESVDHSIWKAAGIYDSIMGSVYKVYIDKVLIFGLVERWCCETNTFMFPWGEATVTLEDMMILGGFDVLGGPVLWLNILMDSGRDTELETFLSLWLSRFVFPGNEYGKIGRHVFPIAVNFTRGTRLALDPAVLASIYKDLSLLKQTMIMASSNEPSWLVPKLYKENGEWTIVERRQNVDQELESFIRFLRVSELVGLDCQEHYRPSRVALQLGYDQDFPK